MDGYNITETLQESGGSTVVRATRDADGQPVILKILTPAYPPPARLARFRREFEICRSLDLSGVAQTLALETHDYRWVIVEEDFGGEALDRVIGRRRPTVIECLDVAIALVEAIGQIHERGVIHKDVNPSNVVWNERTGAVKLIDFGISSRLEFENPGLRDSRTLEGTLAYISPEQTGRINRAVDHRTDFYSLGVTLYELLSGKRPFDSASSMELVHSHLARVPTPLHERADVSQALSAVVGKLMAKSVEGRYQSAAGILADLRECRERARTGATGPFEPGAHDLHERFRIPQRLYGRERELDKLMTAFDRVADDPDGHSEMFVVAGSAGIGKSMLVREVQRPIAARRGYFIAGKFDQLARTPLAGMVGAFRSLVRQLLTEDRERLADWRDRILEAVGPNGRIVTEMIPELELIIDAQPALQPLGPAEAQVRFNLTVGAFIATFARPEHPLTVFLDDLQWADSASLELCEWILRDGGPLCLLLIGAYRDDEVEPDRLFARTLERIREQGGGLDEIQLGPLSSEHVTQLIADTTGSSASDCATLGAAIIRKTGGNPFFVNVFLGMAHRDGLIRFDRDSGCWRWDASEIDRLGATNNVVDLTIDRLRRLPPATSKLLELASCLGSSFDLETLARVGEGTTKEAFAADRGRVPADDVRPRDRRGGRRAVDPHVPVRARPRPASRLRPARPGRAGLDPPHDRQALARARSKAHGSAVRDHRPPQPRGRWDRGSGGAVEADYARSRGRAPGPGGDRVHRGAQLHRHRRGAAADQLLAGQLRARPRRARRADRDRLLVQ